MLREAVAVLLDAVAVLTVVLREEAMALEFDLDGGVVFLADTNAEPPLRRYTGPATLVLYDG